MNNDLYRRLDRLIATQNADPVEALAKRLEVTPRHVKYMIKRLK